MEIIMDIQKIIKNIGKRIRNLRISRGISQEEMALLIDAHQTTLARYESGVIPVGVEQIIAISKVLNIHPAELFEGIAGLPPPPWGDDPVIEAVRESREDLSKQLQQTGRYIKDAFQQLKRGAHAFRTPSKGNVISFPKIEKERSLKFIEHPVGAGETLVDENVRIMGMVPVKSRGRPEYAFLARGYSMEPDILDGSLLMVRPTRFEWKNNDICVVYLRETDEWTVKMVRRDPAWQYCRLIGASGEKEYRMIDVIIQGVVEDVIRDPKEAATALERLKEGGAIARKRDESKDSKSTFKRNRKMVLPGDIGSTGECGKMESPNKRERNDAMNDALLGKKLDQMINLMKDQICILQEVKKNAEENSRRTADLIRLEVGEITAEELRRGIDRGR